MTFTITAKQIVGLAVLQPFMPRATWDVVEALRTACSERKDFARRPVDKTFASLDDMPVAFSDADIEGLVGHIREAAHEGNVIRIALDWANAKTAEALLSGEYGREHYHQAQKRVADAQSLADLLNRVVAEPNA